jgi:hypothetical protein
MSHVINAVFVDCQPEIKAKYNQWYNDVHIPMCLRYEGMIGATRYELLSGPEGQARYLTIYEFTDQNAMDSFPKSSEFTAVDQELHQTWKGPEFTIKAAAQYSVIKSWKK